jgi:hypothetical protein
MPFRKRSVLLKVRFQYIDRSRPLFSLEAMPRMVFLNFLSALFALFRQVVARPSWNGFRHARVP